MVTFGPFKARRTACTREEEAPYRRWSLSDVEVRKQESALARRAWPSLVIGVIMVAIGMPLSQNYGGILIGLFDLIALVLVLLGIIGLGVKLFARGRAR